MAYDVHLADRVRELLVDGSAVTERQGGLLVRVDPARTGRRLAEWIAIGTATAKSPHR